MPATPELIELVRFAIARAGKFSDGAKRLATHYHIRPIGEVYAKGLKSVSLLEFWFSHTLSAIDDL